MTTFKNVVYETAWMWHLDPLAVFNRSMSDLQELVNQGIRISNTINSQS